MSNQQLNLSSNCESHIESFSLLMHGMAILMVALLAVNGCIAASLTETPKDVNTLISKSVIPQINEVKDDIDRIEESIKDFESTINEFHSRMVFLEDTLYIVSEQQREQTRIIYGDREPGPQTTTP